MKNLIKPLLLLFVSLTMTSCLVDDNVTSDAYSEGVNLAGFTSTGGSLNAVADGSEYNFTIPMRLIGPTSASMTEDVSVTIGVDPSSTAVEGVHYRFDSMSATLTAGTNYISDIGITIITDGIIAPLAENPTLNLVVASATGNNVLNNGKNASYTIVYQCYADLTGTYMVTNDFCNPTFMTDITANADGSWHLGTADGGFLHQCTSNTSLLNAGNIVELCGQIQPTGDLEFGTGGGYSIGDISGGTWDPVSGTLSMNHTDNFFNGGPYAWISTYIRQ